MGKQKEKSIDFFSAFFKAILTRLTPRAIVMSAAAAATTPATKRRDDDNCVTPAAKKQLRHAAALMPEDTHCTHCDKLLHTDDADNNYVYAGSDSNDRTISRMFFCEECFDADNCPQISTCGQCEQLIEAHAEVYKDSDNYFHAACVWRCAGCALLYSAKAGKHYKAHPPAVKLNDGLLFCSKCSTICRICATPAAWRASERSDAAPVTLVGGDGKDRALVHLSCVDKLTQEAKARPAAQ